jgi:tetratricopeptide (TPR) repeat protein
MRFGPSIILLAACGGRAAAPTFPISKLPPESPARDLATAKQAATQPGTTSDRHLAAKDPRVVDLDIIRITATSKGVSGEPDMTSVSTADEFRKANEAAKAGSAQKAIDLYRQIVHDFPESQYASVSLFNIAAIYDHRGDPAATIATLKELVDKYPQSRESIDGHLYIAALQADHQQFGEAEASLDALLVRANLTFADRLEALARKGYVEIELHRYDAAETAFQAAIVQWRNAPHIEDSYYIAMAHYYLGEVAHRRFAEAPLRLPQDQLFADLEAKRTFAVVAYDHWKETLRFHQAYWATAAGYQMSQIFLELWQATVTAPYPKKLGPDSQNRYVIEVHDRVREDLEKALEGHRMNVELAKAFGVDTTWSKGSEQQAARIIEMLAKDAGGQYVMPPN